MFSGSFQQFTAELHFSPLNIINFLWAQHFFIFTKIFQALRIDTNKNTNMDVACAVVRTDLKAGKAEFPSGIVFDGSKLKVISSGNINLRNDKIDFTIAPSLNKLVDGNIAQALASFVKIEGTIENPKIGLDQEAALTTIVGTVASGGIYFGSEMLLNDCEIIRFPAGIKLVSGIHFDISPLIL